LNVPQSRALLNLTEKLKEAGVSEKKMQSILRKRTFQMQKYRSEMIARTETARAISEGTLDRYKESHVERVRWEASADACESCAWNDGNEYSRLEAGGMLPWHPNCRCCWVPISGVPGEEELVKPEEIKEKPLAERDITYQRSRAVQMNSKDYETVWVDPKKFDTEWQRNADSYVVRGGSNDLGRMPAIESGIKAGNYLDMPMADVLERIDATGRPMIGFTDGRHRAALLIERGKPFPISVERGKSARMMRELVGGKKPVADKVLRGKYVESIPKPIAVPKPPRSSVRPPKPKVPKPEVPIAPKPEVPSLTPQQMSGDDLVKYIEKQTVEYDKERAVLEKAKKKISDEIRQALDDRDAIMGNKNRYVNPEDYRALTPKEKGLYRRLDMKVSRLSNKEAGIDTEMWGLRRDMNDKAKEWVYHPDGPGKLRVEQRLETIPQDKRNITINIAGKGMAEFEKIVGPNADDYFVYMDWKDTRRPFVQVNSTHVTMGYNSSASHVVHELGHTLENMKPEIRKAMLEWRSARVGTEGTKALNDFLKIPAYDYDEIGWKDKFRSVYIGKYYQSGASEVTSMGLQYLVEDPIAFAKADPDMFKMIIDVLRKARKL